MESSAVFNFEEENFEFETGGKLSVNSIKNQPPSSNQKDFLCYFGPSGSITEKCEKCGVFIKEKVRTFQIL